MQTDVKQVFHFHADAHSVGGFLENPFRPIPTPSSVALSSGGGASTDQGDEFHFEERIHAKNSYTHVSGKHDKRNGPWTQLVSSVVEGFDLFGRVTADRLVGQIAITHPESGGGHRKISFAGSRIENLRVDGKPVTPIFNPTLAPDHQRHHAAYNQHSAFDPDLEWPILWNTARTQGEALLQLPNLPDWMRERFGWVVHPDQSGSSPHGHTLVSLIDKLDGLAPEESFGHCIIVPDLGRIFLGQIRVHSHSANLTMIRAELGCKDTGIVDAGSAGSNGTTMPPS